MIIMHQQTQQDHYLLWLQYAYSIKNRRGTVDATPRLLKLNNFLPGGLFYNGPYSPGLSGNPWSFSYLDNKALPLDCDSALFMRLEPCNRFLMNF